MKSNSGLILLLCGLVSGYLSPVYAQEEPVEDVSEELILYGQELVNRSDSLEDGAITRMNDRAAEEGDPVLTEMGTATTERQQAGLDSFVSQNASHMGSNPGEGAEDYLIENFVYDSSTYSQGKINAREKEHKDLETATTDLTKASDDTMRTLVDEEFAFSVEDNLVSEFRLDYKIDKIESLLDQKLDLTEGVMSAEINALDINPDYGYGATAWQNQNSAVQAQASQPFGERGVDYHHYSSDEDRMLMVEKEMDNLALISDDIAKRTDRVGGLLDSSAYLAQNGGVDLSIDVIGDEKITGKLLEADRKILDIMTEDAYEKDMALYEDQLVHPITGKPLKGYAKRKALKELEKSYGQVEAMRTRNLSGEVLTENEILDVMVGLYDGYNPYAY